MARAGRNETKAEQIKGCYGNVKQKRSSHWQCVTVSVQTAAEWEGPFVTKVI